LLALCRETIHTVIVFYMHHFNVFKLSINVTRKICSNQNLPWEIHEHKTNVV
jgi:hypothetical protein